MDKTHIRKAMRHKRQHLPPKQQHLAAIRLSDHVMSFARFHRCKRFACYIANDGEIDPKILIETAISHNKHCYLPIIDENDVMRFARYTPGCQMIVNRYGIFEPESDEILEVQNLDLICMPLVAFDARGERLGRGKGYYDRALSRMHDRMPYLLGLAHAFQEMSVLPHDKWDVRLDSVCTDELLHKFT